MTARRSFLARLGAAAAAFGFGFLRRGRPRSGGASRAAPTAPAPAGSRRAKRRTTGSIRSPASTGCSSTRCRRKVPPQAIRYAEQFLHRQQERVRAGELRGRGRHRPAPPRDAVRLQRRGLGEVRQGVVGARTSSPIRKPGRRRSSTSTSAGLEGHIKRGVHLAVCDLSTNRLKSAIAKAHDAKPEEIYKELTSTALGNSHFVAAGILAVNRAQERGYAVAHTG